jgi:hypothetical protein
MVLSKNPGSVASGWLLYEFDPHSSSAGKAEAIETYEPAPHLSAPVVVEWGRHVDHGGVAWLVMQAERRTH